MWCSLFNSSPIGNIRMLAIPVYTVLAITIILFSSCASEYKLLKPVVYDQNCLDAIRPKGISTTWYQASVDVLQRHVSGLLLIKELPDGNTRIVFTNEVGVTFFDFEFHPDGNFKIIHIINQMDKKAVVNTLSKDFEILLGFPFRKVKLNAWQEVDKLYYGVTRNGETAYCVTDLKCSSLHYLELGSNRKRKVTLDTSGDNPKSPDTIEIRHHTFDMKITLKKLNKE